jgi:hypothetical protein
MNIIFRAGTKAGFFDPEGIYCEPIIRTVPIEHITRVGKMALYGSSSPRLLVEDKDGYKGIASTTMQDDPDTVKWLKQMSKKVGYVERPRDFGGYTTKWIDV